MRVSIYCRISEDTEGQGLGVARQEKDGRALAKRRRWDVASVRVDNDVSAYKTKVVRPEFEALLDDLNLGLVDGVVVYDLDRFARQPVDLERAIRIFDDRPGLVFATVQSDIDLSTSDGRTMARVMVAFANKSSMDTSRRIRRKHLELAQTGVPTGGWRPFGYKPDRRTLDLKEAALVRQAAADVLGGISMHSICRRWNEQGILTTAGHPWRRQVMRTMLLSPRMAGYRVYQGKKALDANGEPVRGLIEPLLDDGTWEAVKAVLVDPERSGKHSRAGGRKYLLSGIVRCANCSRRMTGNADTSHQTYAYACRPATADLGCGKNAISGKALDPLVEELVLIYLSERKVETTVEPWSGAAELREVVGRKSELMSTFTNGELSGEVVFPAIAKLETQEAELRSQQAEWTRRQVAVATRPTNVAEAWPDLSVEQKRQVISSVVEAVVVRQASKKGGAFDDSRAEVIWR
ncbi:MAG: recombinase family protein [Acidimicrobiales bacterium]